MSHTTKVRQSYSLRAHKALGDDGHAAHRRLISNEQSWLLEDHGATAMAIRRAGNVVGVAPGS